MTLFVDIAESTSLQIFLLNLVWLTTLFGLMALVGAGLLPKRAIVIKCNVLTAGLVLLVLSPLAAEASRRWFGVHHPRVAIQPVPSGISDIQPNAQSHASQRGGMTTFSTPVHKPMAADRVDAQKGRATRYAWEYWIVLTWLLGGGVYFLRALLRYRRVRRVRSTYLEAPLRIRGIVADACRRLALTDVPGVRMTPLNISPHALGIVRPVVVFPRCMLELTDEQLAAVAIHEVAHLKHRHQWTLLLQVIVRGLFFWHPIAHVLTRYLDATQERVCDAHVVRAQSSGRSLARAIVEIAERIIRVDTPGLAMIQRRSHLERRLAALVAPEGALMIIHKSRRSLAALVAIAVFGGCGAMFSAAREPAVADGPAPYQTLERPSAPAPLHPRDLTIVPPRVIEGVGDGPPSIVYSGSRTSATFYDGVAVDEGLAWKGVKAYIGLLPYVVAVDAETNRPRWKVSTSAFYDTLTFRNVSTKPDDERWAVRLRSSSTNDVQTDAYFDLLTGEPIRLPGQENRPAGTLGKPLRVWSGAEAVNDDKLHTLVSDKATWEATRKSLFGDLADLEVPGADEIDFSKHVLLVLSMGRARNCNGISSAAVYYQEDAVLLRTWFHTYQTAAIHVGDRSSVNGVTELEIAEPEIVERPYGLFLFPRNAGRRIVVERNTQGYIAGPPIWKRQHVFDIPKVAAPAG